MISNFNEFLGNKGVVEILERALQRQRLPHALIFAGPPGVGKRTLAELLALRLNCLIPRQGQACGACSGCRRILAGAHPDVRLIQPTGAYIRIDQVREMITEVAYQPFEARTRVVILDGAEQMRPEAANSLLKTVEEPPSRTVIILVTTNPYLLLETIRSRSRMLHFGSIPENLIERFLIEREARPPADARLAAVFSNGSLGAALSIDVEHYRRARLDALRFAALLLKKGGFADASPLVSGLVKDKEGLEVWIDLVARLLQDVYYARISPERIGQRDIRDQLTALSRECSQREVVSSIAAVRELRRRLQRNANRQIALEALFLSSRP